MRGARNLSGAAGIRQIMRGGRQCWSAFLLLLAWLLPAYAMPAERGTMLKEQIRTARRSTVAVVLVLDVPGPSGMTRSKVVSGSGVLVRPGVVATCAHVIAPQLASGIALVGVEVAADEDAGWRNGAAVRTYAGTVEIVSTTRDAAFVKVPSVPGLVPARVGRSHEVEPGDEVFFIGHPALGASARAIFPPAVGTGVIAAIDGAQLVGPQGPWLRIDGSVNKGNSGGGIFSRSDGTLLGIVNAKAGGLSQVLRIFRDTQPTASMIIGGVDPVAVLRQTLDEMENNLQLGIGYAIPIDVFSLPVPNSPDGKTTQ